MKKEKSISVVIMAYNEERNIKAAVEGVVREVGKTDFDYEIILVDDGSTDNTGRIIDELAKRNKKIKVARHPKNRGFGDAFRTGVKRATKTYVIGFPGDNDTSPSSLREIVNEAGTTDFIISYPTDDRLRSPFRRFVSRFFVIFMNLIFGMKLRYFNGSLLCKTKLVKSLNLTAKGFAVYAEAKVKLFKKGYKYKEVPFEHIGRKYGKSKAVSVKSVMETLETIFGLIRDIYFLH